VSFGAVASEAAPTWPSSSERAPPLNCHKTWYQSLLAPSIRPPKSAAPMTVFLTRKIIVPAPLGRLASAELIGVKTFRSLVVEKFSVATANYLRPTARSS
jgi:hypothetical protein